MTLNSNYRSVFRKDMLFISMKREKRMNCAKWRLFTLSSPTRMETKSTSRHFISKNCSSWVTESTWCQNLCVLFQRDLYSAYRSSCWLYCSRKWCYPQTQCLSRPCNKHRWCTLGRTWWHWVSKVALNELRRAGSSLRDRDLNSI